MKVTKIIYLGNHSLHLWPLNEKRLAVILLLVYGVALVKPVLPLVDYYLVMEVYLEQCINKHRPELHCNGQCILMQKLKALNGEAKTPQAPAPVKITLQDFRLAFLNPSHW